MIVSNCDNLEYWTPGNGLIELDYTNKVEGDASITLMSDGTNDWVTAAYNPPYVLNWFGKTELTVSLNPEVSREVRIWVVDINGNRGIWQLGMIFPGWVDYTIDLTTPDTVTGALDLSQVDEMLIFYGAVVGNLISIKIDNIRNGPDPPTHTITINSNPSGIIFNVRRV